MRQTTGLSVFFVLLVLASGMIFFSCPSNTITEPEYLLTLTAEGVTGTVDVAYSNLSTNPVTSIFAENTAAVPYSREVTGTIDHSAVETMQFAATADVADGETLTVRAYYDEVLEFPPEDNRKLIAEGTYTNTTGGPVAAESVYVHFSLPQD
jgi:hypothetical protein